MKVTAWPAFKNKTHNPYNYQLYTHIKKFGANILEFSPWKCICNHFSIIHVHWPEAILNDHNPIRVFTKTIALIFIIIFAKAKGAKIIWTVHNLNSHERYYPYLEDLFWRVFTSCIDGYISLSKVGLSMALERFPLLRKASGVVIPHGDYCNIYPNFISKQEARRCLGLSKNAKVLVFFGQIREYKNVPHLINTFRQLKIPDLALIVAGKPNSEVLLNTILEEASEDKRIHLYLKFIQDEDVQIYMNAADLVVLPYREILNSGSAILALSFNRPVLVPEKGALSELKTEVGDEWVYLYQGELTPQVLTDVLEIIDIPRGSPFLEKYSWRNIACTTFQFYKSVIYNKYVKQDYSIYL